MTNKYCIPPPSSIRLADWPDADLSHAEGTRNHLTPITSRGKFLWRRDAKFPVRGTTYGAFPPNSAGDQFPQQSDAVRDFDLMAAGGFNTILTYTVPPLWLLDELHARDMKAIITTPWMEYICFLQNARDRERVRREVRAAIARCERHPAVLMYCIGKEIPPAIVRWHGARKVERFLRELYDIAKQQDPEHLATYTNFPTTEYLDLGFVDIYTFNVYLHQRNAFCAYLSRLQHLAGELPLVLTEFGMCSFRHGREAQAELIAWQLRESVDHGLAGAVVFGWTDPFYQDHTLIDEWGFGLVDAQRRPKPSYAAARRHFLSHDSSFPSERRWPKISVVVSFHNAARTLEDCCETLLELNYPDYEVILVNDGSTDRSAEIIERYPFQIVTSDTNRGISAGRNAGLRAATGEIIAYIDADARADPDWLMYLARTYEEQDVAGVGGPNPVPPEDPWVAQCVYRSPGGPTQVMLTDDTAEHIPGCNMSFRRAALEDIGGFDEQFTTAADDVDVCWRLIDRGYRLGFNPSALVWHHRRPSVRAYWRQQVGYGLSESRLERKFPTKFNGWGHTFWGGRIYAPYPFFRLFTKSVVYQGLWGSAPFQSMYEPGGGGMLTYLPRAMEWHFALIAIVASSFLFPPAFLLAGMGLAYTAFYCVWCAGIANIKGLPAVDGTPTLIRRLRWRGMIALLHFLEPIARDWGRLKGGLTPWRGAKINADVLSHSRIRWDWQVQPFRRSLDWNRPGGPRFEKFAFLNRMTTHLLAGHSAVSWNQSTEPWDLKVRRGVLAEAFVRIVIEQHGGPRRIARMSATIRAPAWSYWLLPLACITAVAMATMGRPAAGTLAALAFIVAWIAPIVDTTRLETIIRAAAEAVARELDEEPAEPIPAFCQQS